MAHVKAMYRTMRYCVLTKTWGWVLEPKREWDGKNKEFEFVIEGKSDSDYATYNTARRSVSGISVFLEGAPIQMKSVMQKIVALSVYEAETITGMTCVQEMIMAKKTIVSMGLKVKLPMVLKIELNSLHPVDYLLQNRDYNGWHSTLNRNLILLWDARGKIIDAAVKYFISICFGCFLQEKFRWLFLKEYIVRLT